MTTASAAAVSQPNPHREWFLLSGLAFIAAIAAGLAAPRLVESSAGPFLGWLASMGLVLLTFLCMGVGAAGTWFGILIDDRRMASSSRLQAVLWSVLVFGTLLAVAGTNMAAGHEGPLDVSIPGELWVLMGLSSTSLAASQLIKTSQVRSAQLRRNETNEQARLDDLFEAEGNDDSGTIDLGKVQMLFLTVVILGVYGVAIGDMLAEGGRITALPAIDEGMVALLAISHGGYVTYKAVPHANVPRTPTR